MPALSRSVVAFALISLVASFLIIRVAGAPDYTDAYYHFTAAERLSAGQGLTVPYLWTYIDAPADFPIGSAVDSHTYWMPLTSLLAALGMALFSTPGDVSAAQFPFALLLAGTGGIGYFLGAYFGRTSRHAWTAGILTLASPFYLRWWGTIDTFAPYAFFGALTLVAIGFAAEKRSMRWFALVGALGGICHLIRADGLLMPAVGITAACWPSLRASGRERIRWILALGLAYLLVMLPWFIRLHGVTGAILPVGGTQSIWFIEYDDLFAYPADIGPAWLFDAGMQTILSTRWYGLSNGLQTFIAVEGVIFLTPFMLLGLYHRRTPFTRGFWLYALGLHLAMTLVFPFPGARGGLFHSAAALVPWWMAFAICGLDDALRWAVKRLPHWKFETARKIFGLLLVAVTLTISAAMGLAARVPQPTYQSLYAAVDALVPPDARLLASDPAALWYYAGRSGVVLPNETPDVLPEIIARYNVTHLLIEGENIPQRLSPLLASLPDYLIPVTLPVEGGQLYEIRR